ncbi:hypothetical protein Goarm_011343, partial [Gossypium armourianum]|nr:hypothetical protein [Gossypium armourianum]
MAEYEAISSSDSSVNLDDIDNIIIIKTQAEVQMLRDQMAQMQASTVEQIAQLKMETASREAEAQRKYDELQLQLKTEAATRKAKATRKYDKLQPQLHNILKIFQQSDNEGHILAACTYPNEYVRDTTIAEARACVQSLVFVEELGFRKIVVEGDTLTVTKKSSKSSNTWTGTGRQTIRFPDVLDRGGPARVEELADLDRGHRKGGKDLLKKFVIIPNEVRKDLLLLSTDDEELRRNGEEDEAVSPTILSGFVFRIGMIRCCLLGLLWVLSFISLITPTKGANKNVIAGGK